MKTEQQYFDEALPMHDYIAQMDVPFLKEGTEKIYNQFDVPNDGFAERLAGHKILAITENWCGDAKQPDHAKNCGGRWYRNARRFP